MVPNNGVENREGTTPKQIDGLVEFVDTYEFCVYGVFGVIDSTKKINKSDKTANLQKLFILKNK
jgi:hypothetical protein